MLPALPALLGLLLLLAPGSLAATNPPTHPAPFQAGAHSVDISPLRFPVLVNAMFTERTADKVVDPLLAKALALDDGSSRIALCVVDSCMVPRDLLDRAKEIAAIATDIPADHILISATHTHSAPSAMGCLGSRVDPDYAASLPPRIAEAIAGAVRRLAPARIGWIALDDWHHTFNRRWIRRPDKLLNDPFGQPTVRANMHPGYQNPDALGPSGPVDPGLSLIALTTPEGRPLAAFANYSQHYYGSPLLSSDYYGRFASHLARGLGAGPEFVGIMSQGTSGDQMWMDYGSPKNEIGYDAYAREIADRVLEGWKRIDWRDRAPLRMAERRLELRYRVPDAERLAWARKITTALGDKLPNSQPEIYAWEALHLHERQKTELKLQALRIGDLGIAALPNEVFAITGLKLKSQSPLPLTFNISLANGAEGYIPPPEQHALGGYTTWPARTAGLEPQAEPRIVETLLGLLEEVAGQTRRPLPQHHGPYARTQLDAQPLAYWRLDDLSFPTAHDASGNQHHGTFENGIALYVPGAGSGAGRLPEPALTPSEFSGPLINRAVHFAGGRLHARLPLGDSYSVEFWFWNALPADARAITGYLVSRGPNHDPTTPGEHLGIGGSGGGTSPGRLFVFNGDRSKQVINGRTPLSPNTWHHVALVREGSRIRVHLDGQSEPEIQGLLDWTLPEGNTDLFLGGRSDSRFGLEGRLDEIAVFARSLTPDEISRHFRTAKLPTPATAASTPAPASPPLSPAESLARIRLAPGFRAELVAAEPLTLDPVAIDWDLAGRLWVVEMADYPLGLDGKGKAGGRIRVLVDTNHDGRYDQSTLFAEDLHFPNGILTWRDGVLVTAAPEILFLRDTNGDGRADTREVVVRGLLEGNQQLRANGLRWGLDNWVYCAAGGHHGNYGLETVLRTATGDTRVGSRDFRFRPDTGELEPESGPSQYGRNRDDWGHWFGTQNIRPLWHYVLADRYLRRNPHIAAPDPTRMVVVPLSPKVWPASAQEKRYHSFNEAGHFTSACSGMIYRDDLLFPTNPGSPLHAFTCEPFHNLIQHNLISEDGVSFTASRSPEETGIEFFASEDRWCRPVMTRTGPDGALWVVDMYRYMIEHPDWLPAEGKAELLPHYRLGDDRGRIYRVLPSNAASRPPPRLDALDAAGLVAALDSPNGWQRDKVHQRLVQLGDATTAPLLERLLRDSPNPRARVHALGVLDGLHRLTPERLQAALVDPHPGVRENALRFAEPHGSREIITAAGGLVHDPSPKVQLQLALSLGQWTNSDAGVHLARLTRTAADDPFLTAAILSSALPHLRPLAQSLVHGTDAGPDRFVEPLTDLALALGDRDTLAGLLASGTGADSNDRSLRLARFLSNLERRHLSLASLASPDDPLGRQLRELPRQLASAWITATNSASDIPRRIASASLLAAHPDSRSAMAVEAAAWLDPRVSPELQQAALRALATVGDDTVPGLVLPRFQQLSPALRSLALDTLLAREPWTRSLLDPPKPEILASLDANRRSQLLRHSSARIRELAARTLGPVSNRAATLESFRPALALAGDPDRGRTVFARLCLSCHRLAGQGNEVGPDLSAVAAHPPEKLLVNILDPNADIQPGSQAYQAELSDGSELYGLIAAETGNSLTLKLTDGTTRTLLRRELVSLRGGTTSLMPEGLEAGLTPQDLADLIRFLKTPARP
jgi:putative membrane-bound dehydrogenase-like protein